MSVLTNQVHLKIQFRHRFDPKSAHLQTRYTDSDLASLEPRKVSFAFKMCKMRLFLVGFEISALEDIKSHDLAICWLVTI